MGGIRAVVSAIALIADVVGIMQIVARLVARCINVYRRGYRRYVAA